MYEEIFKLIQNGELNKAQEEIEKISDDNPKKYNIGGLLYFQKKEFDKAKEEFEKGLKINPVDSDLLFNYGYLLKDINQEKEAWRYLMRIHNKDWATYDLLGDIEYKNRSKLASLRFYKKAAELPDAPQEMKKKFIEMRNNVKQDTKIAFLCLPGLDNFLKDIVETFSLGYDVKLVVTTDGNQIAEAIKWADIVWLEWANEMAVFATNKIPEIQNKKVVCRLHGYEAFNENVLNKINWKFIDRMVFVADHVREDAFESCSKIKNIPYTMVYNGIDLDKITYNRRTKGKKICFSGYINYKKNPMLMLQILSKLLKIDSEYKVYWVGKHQDIRIAKYMNYILKDLKIEDNFVFEGWTSNIDSWLEDKNYFLSTSIHEGYGVAIMEAMAKGIKPIIHNFYAARGYYPDELIYNTIDEAVEKITEESYDSESYRRFIEDNYSLEEQICKIEQVIKEKKTNLFFNYIKKDASDLKISYCMPVYNGEKFIKKSLESILNQQIKPYKVIIIDDASVDNSYKILQEYLNKYNFIELYRHDKNKGEYSTTLELFNLAEGDFLKILHQDDYLYENYSSEICKIKNINNYPFIINDYAYISQNKVIHDYLKKIWNNFNIDPNELNQQQLLKFLVIAGNYIGAPSNALFKRKELLKVCYSEYVETLALNKLFYGYDFYLFLKLIEINKPFIFFKELSCRLEHANNTTSKYISTSSRVIGLHKTLEMFESILDEKEKEAAYTNLLGRALYSINTCNNNEEKIKMIEYVIANYKYISENHRNQFKKALIDLKE
jgi:glycosyltransferase involved in cell wall biosynthesis